MHGMLTAPRTLTAWSGKATGSAPFSGGLGYGSLGCPDCSGRTGAPSGNISLGGTLSPKLLLGVSTSGWTKSDSGATLTVAALTAAVRFYPSPVGGFFLTGGLHSGCWARRTGALVRRAVFAVDCSNGLRSAPAAAPRH
jgi:hypothetical protein